MSVLDRALIKAFEKDQAPAQPSAAYHRQDGTAVRVDVVVAPHRQSAASRPIVNEVVPLPPPHLKFPGLGPIPSDATASAWTVNAAASLGPDVHSAGTQVHGTQAYGTQVHGAPSHGAPTPGARPQRLPSAPVPNPRGAGAHAAPTLMTRAADTATLALEVSSGGTLPLPAHAGMSILVVASPPDRLLLERVTSHFSTALPAAMTAGTLIAASAAPAASPVASFPGPHFPLQPGERKASSVTPTMVTAPISQPVEPAARSAPVPEPEADVTARPAVANQQSRIRSPFAAVWEVDRFLWPAVCNELREAAGPNLESAGQNLVAACRAGLNVLAISGRSRGEGRSTIALTLARAAAAAGGRVALIDADLHRPCLAAQLQVETPASWLDTAVSREPLEEAAIRSLEDSLTLFPLMPATTSANVTEPFSQLVRRLVNHFELLILDAPPAAEIAGPTGYLNGSLLDAALVVHDLRYPSPEATQQAVNILYRSGIESVGIVENFVAQLRAA